MFEHLKTYFYDELSVMRKNKEINDEDKRRLYFLYLLAYLFLFLFICKLVYII